MKEDNHDSDEFIINVMIRISSRMPPEFLQSQYHNLQTLAGEKQELSLLLSKHCRNTQRKHQLQKMLPLLIILLTVTLCVAMYFYGKQ